MEEESKPKNALAGVFILALIGIPILLILGIFLAPGLIVSNYLASGRSHYEKKEYSKAIKSLKTALKYDRKNAQAYYYLGKTYTAKDDYDRAIINYRKAISFDKSLKSTINPELARAYFKRGGKLIEKGEFRSASADFSEAFALNPELLNDSDPLSLYYQGLCDHNKRHYDEAIDNFSRSLKKNKSPDTLMARAEAYFAKGDSKKAFADLNEVLKLDPSLKGAAGQKLEGVIKSYMGIVSKKLAEIYQEIAEVFLYAAI